MSLDIHQQIYKKLDYFIEIKKIPNIIFHGPCGSGKKHIVDKFIKKIYNNNKSNIRTYVMYVNCAQGKGIKFIRDELKFFAKTNIDIKHGTIFKTVILVNADKLTQDAQSALRRCIELFSHNTRFFIITDNKAKLLKPILSRFCEIYIHYPIINNKITNLHTFMLDKTYKAAPSNTKEIWLKKTLQKSVKFDDLPKFIDKLYEKCYSGIDLINYVENSNMDAHKKYQFLITFNKIKREFRNEKLLMLFILNFIFYRSDTNLENISFI